MTSLISDIIPQVRKRDGRIVEFDKNRIKKAIGAAMEASGEFVDVDTHSSLVRDKVIHRLQNSKNLGNGSTPTIEEIQDIVEETLIIEECPKTAKAYILYRNKRAELREKEMEIPEHVKDLVARSKEFFPNELSEFIFYRTYSRWIEEEGRRETWIETVDRYMDFMREVLDYNLTEEEYSEIKSAILNMEVMPSMRLMWSAGDAARRDNVCAYNCSFIAPQEIEDFGEILYLLMCGTGVGFSVEQQTVAKLPIIEYQNDDEPAVHPFQIHDSKQGWAEALCFGMHCWFNGRDTEFDYSLLRPKGARLKTMGGRSSGPDPLHDLLNFTRSRIFSRQGKRLTSLDVHDIICKIGEIVVSGGVRRSSLISLSDLDDSEMRDAKQGYFYATNPQRQLANNSVAYTTKPSHVEFMEEWLALAKSGSGERGIFNRASVVQQIPSRRLKTFGDDGILTCGTNPCGEIILKHKEFCNLTEVVARSDDTVKSLKRKIRIAAILGTYQSMLTDFPFLSDKWKENCEAERLLGVSVTGQYDCPVFRQVDAERWAKAIACDTNKEFAERFGINSSVAVTCVKPSGTVSLLVDSASGIHPRFAKHYIRRVRISATDPLFQMLRDQKYPFNPEVGQPLDGATTYVLDFPVRASDGSVFKDSVSALDQLEYWKQIKENFVEHNPSCTIYVGENEWLDVGHWVYSNWEIVGGLSFLPREDHVYSLAPHEPISEDRFNQMKTEIPNIDFSQIMVYEREDATEGSKTYACVGDSCEI